MKFLIHLSLPSSYSPPEYKRGPLVFARHASYPGLYLLRGRELSAEEVNEVAESIFRPRSEWPGRLRPSIRVIDDGPPAVAALTGAASELNEEAQNWILEQAEQILQARKAGGQKPAGGEQKAVGGEPPTDNGPPPAAKKAAPKPKPPPAAKKAAPKPKEE